jgi:16S rRNA (adenine1518-N6/adenine1519-N6)-dimethyltransferase
VTTGVPPGPAPLARRRFGQHFLADPRAARAIATALSRGGPAPVLEIGPGRGALTQVLVDAVGRLAAVELDRDLAALLRRRFDPASLVLLEQDVLELDLAAVAPALGWAAGTPLAVAGNLPYNVSKPIADKLVRERGAVGRAVLMFQREVAERLTAQPGTRAYGPLTVLVGRAYAVRVLFHLPPSAFRPRPQVVSTVTTWTAVADPSFTPAVEASLRRVLAMAFAHRRRTLFNNLRAALPGGAEAARALLQACALEGEARAEALPPQAFLDLASRLPRLP